MEKEKRLVRPTDTRALGILNSQSAEEIVEKGLADDERLLTEVFKIFNNEFYDGKLLEPVIHISHAVKEEVGIKITDLEEWVKHDNGKSEMCKGLYFSDKILKYGVVSEMGMENAYIMLAVGMITLYDKEMRDAYKYGVDIRSEEEKIKDRKKGASKGKKSYKGMVTRGGYYYTKEFAKECERIGLIAIPDEDKDGKYLLSAGEIFTEVLEKYNLLNRRFICAKYQQPENQSKELMIRRALIEEKNNRRSVRTYQCPKCKLNVRGTKSGLKIKCCSDEHKGEEFLMEEIKKEEELKK